MVVFTNIANPTSQLFQSGNQFLYSYSQKSHRIEIKITCVFSIIDKEKTDSVLCSKNTIQNDLNIKNYDNMQCCETQRKQKYSTSTNSFPKQHEQLISSMSVHSSNLHTTAKLPPVGKYYMCFQIDGKSTQSARCVKYRIITNVIYCVIYINEF